MPNYSNRDVILVRYPFTDLSGSKVRPAVVVSVPHNSEDVLYSLENSRWQIGVKLGSTFQQQ